MRNKIIVIITIIATIIALILSNRYWLIFKPMAVDFAIKGNGECAIEVLLNKNDDTTFAQSKTQNITINLDENNHAYFKIYRARSPKRLMIVFNDLQSPVTISHIQLRNGKLKLDSSNFTATLGTIHTENGNLTIYPYQNSAILLYNDKLNIKAKLQFDIRIFIIIAVLAFLFTYKITNYLADYNTVKGKSKLEIIFLAAFLIFLFIPMSYINKDEISSKENRSLAKWKPFITENNEINYKFGKHFNQWFSDRFNLRAKFLNIYSYLIFKTTQKSKNGYVDKNGILFLDIEYDHSNYKDITAQDYANLKYFNDFCKQNNIELYVLIVPDKGYVYTPSKQILKNDNYAEDLYNKVKYLSRQYDLPIVFPFKEMQKAVLSQYMFYKTEHHWTDDGAFIGYQNLMKEIVKKHPDIHILKTEDFNLSYNNLVRGDWQRDFQYGQTCRRLNLPKSYVKKLHDVNYQYYTYKGYDNITVQVVDIPKHRYKIFYNPKGANYRVVQLGTSHNENLTEFIPATFKNVLRLRNNNVQDMPDSEEFKIIKYYKKQILDYKPDILIFCIAQKNILHLHNLFNMENE